MGSAIRREPVASAHALSDEVRLGDHGSVFLQHQSWLDGSPAGATNALDGKLTSDEDGRPGSSPH